jgi:hypothetical protein
VLEPMVVRLCASIRTFGGSAAQSPIYAVSPRFSAPLAASTLQAFDRLHVRHVTRHARHRFDWYHFLNKPLSMLAASEVSGEATLVWLDADTLVVRDPIDLRIDDAEALGACVPCNDIGIASGGADDPRDRYWKQLCDIAQVRLEDLPVICLHGSDRPVRLYLQAGVFCVRRDSRLINAYFEMCERLLSSRVVLHDGPHWLEQIALGLALVQEGLNWRQLPWTVNYAIGSFMPENFERPEFPRVQILHYHDMATPANFASFVTRMQAVGPEQTAWLREIGPAVNPQSRVSKLVELPVKLMRKLQRRLHMARSRQLTAAPAQLQPT